MVGFESPHAFHVSLHVELVQSSIRQGYASVFIGLCCRSKQTAAARSRRSSRGISRRRSSRRRSSRNRQQQGNHPGMPGSKCWWRGLAGRVCRPLHTVELRGLPAHDLTEKPHPLISACTPVRNTASPRRASCVAGRAGAGRRPGARQPAVPSSANCSPQPPPPGLERQSA
jgi:hypothetical protein